MTYWYTALRTFDKNRDTTGASWDSYITWSRLSHLTEVVSLDGMLNESLVHPDYDNADDWDFIGVDGIYQTGFFRTVEYVLEKKELTDKFNLLAVVIDPTQDCKDIELEGFEFVGYELLDRYYDISALTNCGGFDEAFLPNDLNTFGLIDDYEKAFDIQKRLHEKYPGVDHADTNVIAVWRHGMIGR
ncbi:MAG: hypothetical protein IPL49_04755 [Saprospirales bacterium]|nr:hypothetical protein [Saprospirales bacterium]